MKLPSGFHVDNAPPLSRKKLLRLARLRKIFAVKFAPPPPPVKQVNTITPEHAQCCINQARKKEHVINHYVHVGERYYNNGRN